MTNPTLAKKGFAPQAIAILSYAILLAGVITIGFSAYLVVVSHSNLPYWDGWSQVAFASNGGGTPHTLDWLWRQFNQHRLFIPRLFLLADLRWFHATQTFLLASVFAIQFLYLLLLSWSMRVLGAWRGALWRSGAGLAAFCLFCPSQWQNQTMGISGLCFDLPGLFATLSFVGLLLYWVHSGQSTDGWGSWKYLSLSIAAALGGTLTLSNGNLLWPLLVAVALLLRLRPAAVLSLAIAGAVSTSVYLHNYTRPPSVIPSLETPTTTLRYLTAYFGSSWVQSNVRVAELIGLAGLALFFLLLLRFPSYVRNRSPFCVQLLLTLVFCVGTGLFTALGRLVFGVAQAFSSRYQAYALLFWCCMALLLLAEMSSARTTRNIAFLLSQVILLVIMLVAARLAPTPLTKARVRGFQLNAAAMALVTDVPDMDQLQWADSQPGYVLSLVPYMRKERLSVFSGMEPSLLGKPLDSMFNLASPNECKGELESTTVVPSAWPRSLRITGWAWDSKHRRPPSEIVIATYGVIIGLGAVGDWHPVNKAANPWMTSNFIGYTGYVQNVEPSSPMEIYAILRGSPASACLIAAK